MITGIDRGLPLSGREIHLKSSGISALYCADLLRSLGAVATATAELSAAGVASDWASSGLAALTGYSHFPMQGPAAIPSAACGIIEALRLLAVPGALADINGAALLTERAALMSLGRQGQISANGSCRLLRASDGWVALNLAREEDWDLMPAWLDSRPQIFSWDTVASRVAAQSVSALLERGRLMGLPIASATSSPGDCDSWFSVSSRVLGERSSRTSPVVVDLSSLWAGPLCTHLLSQTGARVIKIESEKRPDGARQGNTDFFDLLNAGKECVALDFSSDKGRAQLKALLSVADIVVEGSRPRALQQLGIDAQALVHTVPGLTWISITGYGRGEPQGSWVAFGDDAAVAAGVAMATADPPVFCGDALADPLTGMHAALAALAFWQGGGGVLLDLSLRNVTAHCLSFCPNVKRGQVVGGKKNEPWQLELDSQRVDVKPPKARHASSRAAAHGSDTMRVLTEFDIPC